MLLKAAYADKKQGYIADWGSVPCAQDIKSSS